MQELAKEIAAAMAVWHRKKAALTLATFAGGGLFGVAMFAAGWLSHG